MTCRVHCNATTKHWRCSDRASTVHTSSHKSSMRHSRATLPQPVHYRHAASTRIHYPVAYICRSSWHSAVPARIHHCTYYSAAKHSAVQSCTRVRVCTNPTQRGGVPPGHKLCVGCTVEARPSKFRALRLRKDGKIPGTRCKQKHSQSQIFLAIMLTDCTPQRTQAYLPKANEARGSASEVIE
jgi:hypothetical protein